MVSLWKEIRNNKIRSFRTLIVYMAFLGVGAGLSITGPTLLDLQIAVNSTLSETSRLIQSRSVGYAIGSVSAGFLVELMDEQLLMGITGIINAVAMAVTAWNRTLLGMIITLFINGLAMSHMDTGSNVAILRYWGKSAGGFLQILHFMFAIGGLISPIIAKPFLLERPEADESLEGRQGNNSSNTTIPMQIEYQADDVLVQWPFTMIGGHFLLVSLLFLILYFFFPKDSKKQKSQQDLVQVAVKTEKQFTPLLKAIIIIIVSIFSHIYFGILISFANLLPSFVVKSNLQMTKAEAASLMTVYWFVSAAYRIPVVFLSTKISHATMIAVHVTLMVLTSSLMVFFGESNQTAIYILTAFMAMGMAPVFAGVLGFLQQYFTVSGRITSIFIVSACVGEFLYPWLISRYLEQQPRVFLYTMAGCSVIDLVTFGGTYLLCNYVVNKARQESLSKTKERY